MLKMLIQFELPMYICKCVLALFICSSTLAGSYGHIRSQKASYECHIFYAVARFSKLSERENMRDAEISRKSLQHVTLVPLRSLKVKRIDSQFCTAVNFKIVALREQNTRNLTQ